MAIASIADIIELHRKLKANVLGRGREGDAEGEAEGEKAMRGAQEIEALQARGEQLVHGQLEAQLKRLRNERDRVVADYEVRLRELEEELEQFAAPGGAADAEVAEKPEEDEGERPPRAVPAKARPPKRAKGRNDR
jgi:hypothetical protein